MYAICNDQVRGIIIYCDANLYISLPVVLCACTRARVCTRMWASMFMYSHQCGSQGLFATLEAAHLAS